MSAATYLEPGARNLECVNAFAAAVHEHGSGCYRLDTCHSFMTKFAETPSYWASYANQHAVYGLVRFEKIGDDLERIHGVLCWVPDIDDGFIRLINAKWLTSHADIRAFVTGAKPPGFRCRFCRAEEIQNSLELVPVEPPQGYGVTRINNTVQLQTGLVYTHRKCAKHWLNWVSIAEQYPSQEAAEAADKEAGREALVSTVPLPTIIKAPECKAGRGDA